MLSGNSDLNEKLRQRLEQAEAERTRAHEAPAAMPRSCQYSQSSASLKALRHEKRALNDLQRELQDIGVRADSGAEESPRQRRDELHAQLSNNRSRRTSLEKALPSAKRRWRTRPVVAQAGARYGEMREQVAPAKSACAAVMRMVKDNGGNAVCTVV